MTGKSPGASAAALRVAAACLALILAPRLAIEARPAAKAGDAGNGTAMRGWLPGNYPIPLRDPGLCGHTDVVKTEFLCDPDGILTDIEADRVS